MKACLFVGFGGAVGSVFRYLIGLIPVNCGDGFPVKTLVINILGSFAIGLITAIAGKHTGISPNLLLLLKTGICGGFTTFSTFALESTSLIQNGKIWLAVLYVLTSILFSVAAIFFGEAVVR